jgi:quinol monooxygenase YgiN
MPYVRLTLNQPRPEVRAEVVRHYRELVNYVKTLPGCLDAFVLESHDETAEVGRLSMWESEEAANHAANDPHAMSLHAELLFDSQGQVWDRSFEATR